MTANFDIMALCLLLPLLGALVTGTLGKQLGKSGSALVACASIFCSFCVVAISIFRTITGLVERSRSIELWNWAAFPTNDGSVDVAFGIFVDPLSLSLMAVITGVGFLIHVFSVEYMKSDPGYIRYFCLLNLFVAAMTLLVLANNFATLIIGWGGVGFASFALIGFWREKPSAAEASKKAFVMNVIGDIGLMLAVFILFQKLGVLDYQTLFTKEIPQLHLDPTTKGWVNLLIAGIMIGAYAKSAQLPLHTWLPDAMEGPTPVSALIHAATMVTAGVYLLVRSAPILELSPSLMHLIAGLGAATALYAALCALVQNDLKRVLAYSTMSQLGYMFLAVGVGAYGAAIFHLVTHAFFKALLFLTAGIVIHTAHGEQDMRRLGGLRKDIPRTFVMFGVGGACLAGLPLTSGFFSKEAILHSVHHNDGGQTLLFLVGAGVAILTAFYTGRAFFMTFFGPQRVEHPHLPGGATTLSCLVLTILALAAGFGHEAFAQFLGGSEQNMAFMIEEPWSLASGVLSALVIVAVFVAMSLYSKGQVDKLGRDTTMLKTARSGFGVDETFRIVAGGFVLLGRIFNRGLDKILSGSLPDTLGSSFYSFGKMLKETQTGQLRHYMVSIVVSFMVLLIYALFLEGGI